MVLRAKYEIEKTHLTWRQKRGGQYFGYQLLNRNGVQVIEYIMAATGDPWQAYHYLTFRNSLFSAVTSRGRVKGVETVVEATADKKKEEGSCWERASE